MSEIITADASISDIGFEEFESIAAATSPVLLGRRAGNSDDPANLLSRADAEALWSRIRTMVTVDGDTQVTVRSSWYGHLRWARNRPSTSGLTLNRWVMIERVIKGVRAEVTTNQLDDESLRQAVQRVEQQQGKSLVFVPGGPLSGLQKYVDVPIWKEATARITAQERSEAALGTITPLLQGTAVAAGYVATNVETWSIFNTKGLAAYARATGAMYGVNMRDPVNAGSGWGGRTHNDWSQLDIPGLAARAMEKCRSSANPRTVEPGRYTSILEPEAVSMLMFHAMYRFDRAAAEGNPRHAFGLAPNRSKIGYKVFDERLSISSDPMDAEAGYMPFDRDGYPYRAVTWVERGILKELPYDRNYAQQKLKTDLPLPNPIACRVSTNGTETSMEDMIASTERGLLVTRFGLGKSSSDETIQVRAWTRDGLWLVEKGKIRTPVRNMWVLESPLYAFNSLLQVGRPERVWGRRNEYYGSDVPSMAVNHGWVPFVLPAMKVQDFNFIALADAV